MAAERLSVRKIKEILRLNSKGLSNREIGRICSIAHSTVANYLSRASAAGLKWPLPEDVDDAKLEGLLFPPPPHPSTKRPLPDWSEIHKELKRKGVTLSLVWEEYKSEHPDGYQYSRFCELYRKWRGRLNVWMRQDHKAGEKLFVDYSGHKVDVVDPATGEAREAEIFVAVMGASNYTYVEATWSQSLPDWIASHKRAFAYFGGVPELEVVDNLKSGVTSPCRYEPDLNPTFQDMASHYGVAILPARVRSPKDKPKVEVGVQMVGRWILAALRNRTFFSLDELNRAISELLEKLNNRPLKKLSGTRRSLFESLDKPALKPLPLVPYQYAEWKKARVHIDYHVEVDRHYYSVHYQMVGKKLDIRITANTIECFHRGKRVASHRRSFKKGGHTTLPEHMPKSHREYLKWTPQRLLNWAAKVGPSVEELAQLIMKSRAHPQQGFRSILGILRLTKTYGDERLEAACKRALAINAKSFKSVKSILKNGLDRRALKERETDPSPVRHHNIRGAQYYSSQKGDADADPSRTGKAEKHEDLGNGQGPGGADGHAGRQFTLI